VVDAGPAKVLALPATDLTLFGHATAPANEPLTVQWTQASGPTTVGFSAPKALATTVTFTTSGLYVFQLTASDGTATVTRTVLVTVTPATSQTAFYVDPTFTGRGTGTAQAPWTSLADGNPHQAVQWATINRALAHGPVIIYFSARQAGADTPEELVGSVRVGRTDTSSHRLTLDGMSQYNTNDTRPSWIAYSGSSKMRIRVTKGCCFSIGWDDDVQRDYITIRGFEVTGSGARIRWGGSYSVLEYIWSHDVTDVGATVQFNAAVTDYPDCHDLGKAQDITVRNNLIERGIGEGIYIAGTYTFTRYGGCPSYGNTHRDILIENNTIRAPGAHGGQGDGIDLKGGLLHVTVRNNVIQNAFVPETGPGNGGDGIVAEGVFPPAQSQYLFEGNRIFDGTGYGIIVGAPNGIVIRNNVVYNNGGGIYAAGDPTLPAANVAIYNNTVYRGGVGIGETHGIKLRNNLLLGTGRQIWGYNATGIDSDYNLFAPTGSAFAEGPHSIVHPSTTGIVVNLATGDFHLVPASPARAAGADLSATGFGTDVDGLVRPQGLIWDIGAYAFVMR
jgi:predicted outer membrane repeat protein